MLVVGDVLASFEMSLIECENCGDEDGHERRTKRNGGHRPSSILKIGGGPTFKRRRCYQRRVASASSPLCPATSQLIMLSSVVRGIPPREDPTTEGCAFGNGERRDAHGALDGCPAAVLENPFPGRRCESCHRSSGWVPRSRDEAAPRLIPFLAWGISYVPKPPRGPRGDPGATQGSGRRRVVTGTHRPPSCSNDGRTSEIGMT